jgi:hypothetical protein
MSFLSSQNQKEEMVMAKRERKDDKTEAKYNYVSEIVQLIEITPFLVEHVLCSPDGIMEWWNIGLRLVEPTPRRECWFE